MVGWLQLVLWEVWGIVLCVSGEAAFHFAIWEPEIKDSHMELIFIVLMMIVVGNHLMEDPGRFQNAKGQD